MAPAPVTPEAILSGGAHDLAAAFRKGTTFASKSLMYDPRTLKYRADAVDPDTTYNGHSSDDLAAKVVDYMKAHGKEGDLHALIQQHQQGASSTSQMSPTVLAATSAGGAAAIAAHESVLTSTVSEWSFSFAAVLSQTYGFKIVYCITWIILGALLMFFGLSSFYWGTTPRLKPKTGKTSRRILGGGAGGIVVGFLAGSSLAAIIFNAVAARRDSAPGPGATFAIWLVPGLVLLPLSAHVRLISRICVGLLGGVCLTLIITATFGIHTILVRAILLAVFSLILTIPLLIPPKARYPRTKRLLLNLDTSLIGAVILLDGVALFAPSKDPSHAWIDLWTVLFAPDDSLTATTAEHPWGSGAFKAYIAGAFLCVVISVAFEAWVHRTAGDDVQDEWNEYLGVYTGTLEKGVPSASDDAGRGLLPGSFDRAGIFEPPRSLWNRFTTKVADLSTIRSRPAVYGNLSGGSEAPLPGGFTDRLSRRPSRVPSRRATSQSLGQGPARFEAWSRREAGYDDEGDSDSDATDVEDAATKSKPPSKRQDEKVDSLATLPSLSAAPARPGLLTSDSDMARLPSYKSEVSVSDSQAQSALSGSTAVSSNAPEKGTDAKAPASARDTPARSGPMGTAANFTSTHGAKAQLPATPSLINAIDRIQKAQQQARAWQSQQSQQLAVAKEEEEEEEEATASAGTAERSDAPAKADRYPTDRQKPRRSRGFDGWWKEKVEKAKR